MSADVHTRNDRGASRRTPTLTTPPAHPGFRPDIQGLRAVAVGLVVLHHFFGWPGGGFIGVDVFFVISGYLISDLLLRELRLSGRISMREFYARRMRRIFPMAVVVLAATVAVAYALFTAQRADSTAIDALWAFLFVENWHLASVGTDYFRMGDAVSPVQQYWSLSVEEQYYLVWPLLLIGIATGATWLFANRYRLPNVWRLRRTGSVEDLRVRLVVVTLTVIVVTSFTWAVVQSITEPTVAYFSTFTRAWELGAGALLAVLVYKRPTTTSAATRGLLVAAGLGVIFVSSLFINAEVGFPGPWAAVPVLATLVVLRFGVGSTGVASRLLGAAPMQYGGKISYSLYLWHFPVMVFLFSLVPPSLLSASLGITISIGLAAVSYVLIEDPVRRSQWLTKRSERTPSHKVRVDVFGTPKSTRSLRVMRNLSLTGAALALAALAASGIYPRVVTAGTHYVADVLGPDPATPVEVLSPPVEGAAISSGGIGFDHYAALKIAQQQALNATEFPAFTLEPGWNQLDAATSGPECTPGPERSAVCDFPEPGATKTAMMLGDSQLQAWLPAVREALAGQGYNLKVFVLPGCTTASVQSNYLFSGNPFEYCTTFRENALAEIERAQPDLTLVTSLMESYQVQTNNPKGPAADEAWRAGVATTLSRTGAASQRTVLLDSPPLGEPVTECQTRFASPDDCETTVTALYQHVAGLNAAGAQDAAAQGLPVVHVPVTEWFCFQQVCPSFVGLNPTYSDRLHVSPAFGKFVAPLLRTSLVG